MMIFLHALFSGYIGEMAERSNAAVSKTVVRLPANRGFESPSLRNDNTNHPPEGGWFLFLAFPFKTCFDKGKAKNKNPAKRVCN